MTAPISPTSRTHHAEADGVRIAYELREKEAPSDAAWLVLVHGLGYARWGWRPLVPALADRHRLVLLDNRGIGDSDVPPGPYSAGEMAGDVVAVMDHAGIDRAHLAGTSLGGMIAQEAAADWPDRIDRLVLLASTPGGERAHPMPEVTQRLIAEMPGMEPARALRRAVANALASPADEEVVEQIVQLRLADPQDPDGWQAQAAAGTTYDAGERLGRISAPTLIVHGEQDVVVDPRNAELLGELIDDAEVELLPDAGHLLFWDRPQQVAELMVEFLSP